MKLYITGVGMVSPLGVGKEVNWKRLINSEPAVKYNEDFDIHSACVDSLIVSSKMRQYEMAKTAIWEAM
jgi:3-oxoacyl-(acyl-carrier-protein) synthase